MDTYRDNFHIYLDSDYGRKQGNQYQFQISPPIQIHGNDTGLVFLKEFSGQNNLYNINETNQTASIQVGSNAVVSVVLDIGYYSSGKALASHLTTKFASTGVSFAFIEATLKMMASSTLASSLIFSGVIFERMLNFPVDTTIEITQQPVISTNEIDINRGIHNVYVSVAEISNNVRMIGSNYGIPNRISKIPLVNAFGNYVVYQANDPVQKSPIENVVLSNLTVQLSSDDLQVYEPERFTATLCIEVVRSKSPFLNQIQAPAGYYHHSKNQPLIANGIHRSC